MRRLHPLLFLSLALALAGCGDDYSRTGRLGAGWGDGIPGAPALDLAAMRRGGALFAASCATCHGATGRGDGIVSRYALAGPAADLQSGRVRRMADGELFGVVTEGRGRMEPAAAVLKPEERWLVVAYLRALQAAENVPVGTLSPAERARLSPPGTEIPAPGGNEVDRLRAADLRTLNSYGWVDPGAEIVHIPIDRAIASTLPVLQRKPAGTSPSPAP